MVSAADPGPPASHHGPSRPRVLPSVALHTPSSETGSGLTAPGTCRAPGASRSGLTPTSTRPPSPPAGLHGQAAVLCTGLAHNRGSALFAEPTAQNDTQSAQCPHLQLEGHGLNPPNKRPLEEPHHPDLPEGQGLRHRHQWCRDDQQVGRATSGLQGMAAIWRPRPTHTRHGRGTCAGLCTQPLPAHPQGLPQKAPAAQQLCPADKRPSSGLWEGTVVRPVQAPRPRHWSLLRVRAVGQVQRKGPPRQGHLGTRIPGNWKLQLCS